MRIRSQRPEIPDLGRLVPTARGHSCAVGAKFEATDDPVMRPELEERLGRVCGDQAYVVAIAGIRHQVARRTDRQVPADGEAADDGPHLASRGQVPLGDDLPPAVPWRAPGLRLRALARRGETHVVRVEAKSPDTVAEAVFAQRGIRDDRDGADLLPRIDFPDLDLLIDAGGQPAAGGADRDVEDEPGGTGKVRRREALRASQSQISAWTRSSSPKGVLAVTRRRPSGRKARRATGPRWPLRTRAGCALAGSQTLIVRSEPPEAIRLPSGRTATHATASVCPRRTVRSWPVAASQTRTVPS